MDVIDEHGRLFGTVNVVDALAVVLVVAVVVAGVAVVDPLSGGERETRYATVDLGEQPAYVAAQISAGDVISPDGSPNDLTVTDVYVTPLPGGQASVTVRAEIVGRLTESRDGGPDAFVFNDTRVRSGARLWLETTDYSTDGTVRRLEADGRELTTNRTRVRLASTVSPAVARKLDAGETVSVAGRQVAEIDTVHVGPADEEDTERETVSVARRRTAETDTVDVGPTDGEDARRVVVGVELETLRQSGAAFFAGERLAVDNTVTLATGDYTLNASVQSVDAGAVSTRTVDTVIETNVSRSVAGTMSAGDTYRLAGRPVATITSVETYPTANRTVRRAVVGVELRTVDVDGTPQFGETPVQIGRQITFRTDEYSVTGTVESRGPPGAARTTETRTVTVKLANVSGDVADDVTVGLTERSGDRTTARVTAKRVEPAVVVLTSDDGNIYQRRHPQNKDVYLTVEIQVTVTDAGVSFHGESLQIGDRVLLDFERLTVRGTVIEIEDGG